MDTSQFGPFANIVALGCALVATFSVLLLNMVGNKRGWTWLVDDSPDLIVTAGARMLAIVVMAVTYVTINSQNYGWFAALALICGGIGFYLVFRFDRLRKVHLMRIPETGSDGTQLEDGKGNLVFRYLVIGRESDLLPSAKCQLEKARKEHGNISLEDFVMGAGGATLGNPTALWDRELLAKKSSTLTLTLMSIFLLAVVTLFLAAFVIEVSGRVS